MFSYSKIWLKISLLVERGLILMPSDSVIFLYVLYKCVAASKNVTEITATTDLFFGRCRYSRFSRFSRYFVVSFLLE